ncbi:MAG: ribose-5-phosphate isomerase RpiA [Candidatus Heimdallarchaeota archaeon]|nr:ribose-5-phosphate isomerase RpiA [Candidatus Heimdallarchaeota archaeon]
MPQKDNTILKMKQKCAQEAIKSVKEGMILGIGSGSTVCEFISILSQSSLNLQKVICIPSSFDTEALLVNYGLQVGSLNQFPTIDLTFDGADRVDKDLNCIKGGGGALLREKIIGAASKALIILVDKSKMVPALGNSFPVPIEVIPHARAFVYKQLRKLGGKPALRIASDKLGPTITDNGNVLLDTSFEEINDVEKLEQTINSIPGVMENGLFPNKMVHQVILGTEKEIKIFKNSKKKE